MKKWSPLLIVAGAASFLMICGICSLVSSDFLFGTEWLISKDSWPVVSPKYWDMVNDRVKVGDDRDQAIRSLAYTGAWYHGEYLFSDQSIMQDCFFYGPQQRELTTMIIILSRRVHGQFIVYDISRADSEMLAAGTNRYCLPPIFDENTPTAK